MVNIIYYKKYIKYKNKYLELKKNQTQNYSNEYEQIGGKKKEKKNNSNKFNIKIFDENNNLVNTKKNEHFEQSLAQQHIESEDIVLELGARYGSVSVTINKILKNKKNHVVVEPDSRVWDALEKNRIVNGCKFKIFKGLIGKKKYSLTNKDCYNGYGTTMIENSNSDIESITLDNLIKRYKIEPNVLVVDCEGCFEIFLDENKDFIKNLRMIMYEADYPQKCNYIKIEKILIENGFKVIDIWFNQYVWKKIKSDETIDYEKQMKYLNDNRGK